MSSQLQRKNYDFYFRRDFKLAKALLPKDFVNNIDKPVRDEIKYAYLFFAHQAYEKGLKSLVEYKYPDTVKSLECNHNRYDIEPADEVIANLLFGHKLRYIINDIKALAILDNNELKAIELPRGLSSKFSEYYFSNRYPSGTDVEMSNLEMVSIFSTLEKLYKIKTTKYKLATLSTSNKFTKGV